MNSEVVNNRFDMAAVQSLNINIATITERIICANSRVVSMEIEA